MVSQLSNSEYNLLLQNDIKVILNGFFLAQKINRNSKLKLIY